MKPSHNEPPRDWSFSVAGRYDHGTVILFYPGSVKDRFHCIKLLFQPETEHDLSPRS